MQISKEEWGQGIRVLYVDHWTLGLHNFKMYDSLLKNRGCTTKLFHIGSYRSEKQSRQILDGIECLDISYYRTKNIGRILDYEKPDVIIALNHFELFERSLFKAAHNRSIPCIYVMHGIRLEDLASYQQFYGSNTGLNRRLKKIPKYYDLLKMFAFAHIESDLFFLLRKKLYQLAWRYVTNPIREIYQPETDPATQPDVFLLYSKFDRRLYHQVYGFPEGKLEVIGNTKLDGLFNRVKELSTDDHRAGLFDSLGLHPGERYILNIEDAMVEMNPKSFPHERQADWYRYMEQAVDKGGYRFVVKVHPGTDFNRFKTIFGPDSVTKVVQNADLDGLLYHSEAVVGTISTALINAAALEKVILACEWLDVEMLKASNFYVKYGGAISCRTEQEFEQRLADLHACERQLSGSRGELLDLFVTYRDGRSRERMADAIVAIARGRKPLTSRVMA